MKKHLAIMSQTTIEQILSGKKTIETRFSKNNIPPYGQVSVGDIVYLKAPGGEIQGQFIVKKIYYFEGLIPSDIERIFIEWGDQMGIPNFKEDEYYRSKKESRYGTLIWTSKSERFITSPIRVKKSDQRGWMVLE